MVPPRIQHENGENSTNMSNSDGEEARPSPSAIGLGDEMIIATRRRREAKRKVIQEEHSRRVQDIHTRILLHQENHSAKIDTVRASQWKELRNLLEERSAVERRIQDAMKKFERDTYQLTRELGAVLEDRLEELETMEAKPDN